MKTSTMALFAALSAAFARAAFCAADTEAWLTELEELSDYESPDWFDGEYTFVPPSPKEVEEKYNLTKEEVLAGLKTIAVKYGVDETNETNKSARKFAISHIGHYGTTNELAFLAPVLCNPGDYAQRRALGACVTLLDGTDAIIPFVHSVATNTATFSWDLRSWTVCRLFEICDKGGSDAYIDDPALHAKIAAYFLERAKEEVESSLYVDRCTCRLNPWYRHSQLRRDNLARARSREQNLTETAAAAYDARQRDAAAEGD